MSMFARALWFTYGTVLAGAALLLVLPGDSEAQFRRTMPTGPAPGPLRTNINITSGNAGGNQGGSFSGGFQGVSGGGFQGVAAAASRA